MPLITNTSYLELPVRKRFFFFGEQTYKRIYFSMNKAKKCVDFKSGNVSLPSPEEMKKALAATMLNKLGRPEQPFPSWMIYLILLVAIATALKVFGVIV